MKQLPEPAHNAVLSAQVAVASYRASGNPLFLWGAIAFLTAEAAPDGVELPKELRAYLRDASRQIREAATEGVPGAFPEAVVKALGFGGRQGSSVARDYARDQSSGLLVAAFEELRRRGRGAGEAQGFIGDVLGVSSEAVEAQIEAARDRLLQFAREAGLATIEGLLPGIGWASEATIAGLLRGMPHVVGRGRGRAVRRGNMRRDRVTILTTARYR
ncbi:hypothetical protein ACE7GA_24315 [Roseomonas sp. CCTCC AB2023176]|uniref:hypothetical protein n=1 Tax=Roseomonas sp. CCTCC AB2023176 TaxID=3342640 RepID=UPI0035DD0A41